MNQNSINSVELQGRVGTVRVQSVGGRLVSNFSLQTEHHYELKDGSGLVCECTWHNCVAYEGGEVDTNGMTRGSLVHVCGRLRNNRYTAADGSERTFTEVIASSLHVKE